MSDNRDSNNQDRIRSFLRRDKSNDDAFEKEAGEGFAEYDAQELSDALKETDAKISRMLDDRRGRKNHHYGYWFAAAALLVISSVTGYFLISTTLTEKDLAVQEQKKRLPPQAPEERMAPVKVAKEINEEPASGSENRRGSIPERPAPEGRIGKTQQATDDLIGKPKKSMNDSLFFANNNDLAESAAPPVNTSVSDEPLPGEAGRPVSAPAVLNTEKTASKKSSAIKYARAADAESTAPAAMNTGRANNICYYGKGEKALNKRISDTLSRRSLLYRFEARLFVGQNGKVDSVRLEKATSFSAAQMEELRKILLQLDGFIADDARGKDFSSEYFLDFRP